jgi:hypothetical protein
MRLDFCVACGHRGDVDHHHLIPRARGGSDDASNLVTNVVKRLDSIFGRIAAYAPATPATPRRPCSAAKTRQRGPTARHRRGLPAGDERLPAASGRAW